jgi:hypothetical protein
MHTLGSINPHTLFVDLNGAARREIDDARAGHGSPRGWEIYEHEARHWRDLLATVWGRSYLDLLFKTYDAILKTPDNRMEATFAQVLELFDRDRSILFPSYYKYVMPKARTLPSGERWSMGFSTGIKVASDGSLDEQQPFIFVRFDAGLIHLARQPVSEGHCSKVGRWPPRTRPPPRGWQCDRRAKTWLPGASRKRSSATSSTIRS